MRPGKAKPLDSCDEPLYRFAIGLCGRRRGLAVDGGAHLGTWTRMMARDFATVVAFEPQPDIFAKLLQYSTSWPEATRCALRIHKAALHSARGVCRMVNDPKRATSTAAYAKLGPAGNEDGSTDVEVLTLDGLKLHALDLLKLDLEGGELFALQGARDLLREHRPVVVLEESKLATRHYGIAPDAARRFLEDMGYAVAARDGVNVVMAP
jgi:FkbM family methyltransferase